MLLSTSGGVAHLITSALRDPSRDRPCSQCHGPAEWEPPVRYYICSLFSWGLLTEEVAQEAWPNGGSLSLQGWTS